MYYVVYGLLWLISLLPLRVLYVLSDCIYGLVFYVFKYRKDVVMKNLLIAFPEKTEKERRRIAKKFYHNFIDMSIETLKMLSVSEKVLEKRFTANWDLINEIHSTGKSLQVHVGHYFTGQWHIHGKQFVNCFFCHHQVAPFPVKIVPYMYLHTFSG